MTHLKKAISTSLLAITGLALTVNFAEAQSSQRSYGSTQADSFTNRYNASRFTTKNLRSRLDAASRDRSYQSNLSSFSPSSKPKPFSSVNRGPAVSPYLGLSSSFNQANNYYTNVRPRQQQQQQQQRQNQQLHHQNLANQHRLNQMAAEGPFSITGNENSAPTGHSAVFQSPGNYLNTGGYFAGPPMPSRSR